ncbi:hypothetical protein SL56_04975 [Klebsiella pneumoniae]|nr:hypothetical protein SL56_04975 [Klebsiella pneumoniae]
MTSAYILQNLPTLLTSLATLITALTGLIKVIKEKNRDH